MLGEITWLTWKSKSTLAKEQEEYEKWAFPYGAPQREKIEALLKHYFPKEEMQVALVSFLTCKELFSRAYNGPETYDATLKRLKRDMRRYRNVVNKKQAPTYAAISIADALITPELDYPSHERLMEIAAQYEAAQEEKRRFPFNLF